MIKIDQRDINKLAYDGFGEILESCAWVLDIEYEDMSSEQQKELIIKLKDAFSIECDKELENIEENWSEDSSEIKELKNRIKVLERENDRLRNSGNWGEDMGK